jgi:predicted RNase H-like HicB family nuclease
MYTFDVLVWEDPSEDGSMGYGTWCSYVYGVWGQGDTEEEALQEIKLMITDVVNDPQDLAESLVDPQDAEAEITDMIRERETEGVPCWIRQISVTDSELAGV